MVSDDKFDELAQFTEECIFVTPVCDPSFDDALVPV